MHLWEAPQTISERPPQRLELLLEMPPVPDTARVERLAHLLGAGCAHRALGLVEVETGGVELQAAVLEQFADAGLGILYELLVLHVQDLAREYRVPVIHEGEVAAV